MGINTEGKTLKQYRPEIIKALRKSNLCGKEIIVEVNGKKVKAKFMDIMTPNKKAGKVVDLTGPVYRQLGVTTESVISQVRVSWADQPGSSDSGSQTASNKGVQTASN